MKKIIIIGATSGIGRALAKVFVENEYIVGLSGRRSELLNSIKQERPDRYFIKKLDVTDTDSLPVRLNALVEEIGGLDILVNSAGFGHSNEELDFSIDKQIIDINVVGFTAVIDWAYNYFKQNGSGHIVGISSVSGVRGHRFGSFAYSAAKSFQMIYLEGLRHKIIKAKLPINVTDIRPGFVDTDMIDKEKYFWVISADKAARQIFKSITKKKKMIYITKRWIILVALLKIIPNMILNRI